MTDLTLEASQTILRVALEHCRAGNFKPMGIVVLDARGTVRAAITEDKTSLKRFEVAHGKAFGSLALGIGSRSVFKRAKEQPFFVASVTDAIGGALVPVPGGVLIRDAAGDVIGAVGISGDTSENDEEAAMAGIAAAGLQGDPGAD